MQSGLGTSGIVAVPIPPGGAPGDVLAKFSALDYDMVWSAGGGGGAPANAEYLVGAVHAGLSAERLVVDTATIVWDFSVAGQASADVVGGTGDGYPPQLGHAGI